VIEVHVAALAAKAAGEEHLTAMALACDELANPELDLQARAVADLQFHRTLAASCGNEIFGVVLDSLHRGLIEVRRHNLVSHEALTEAVSSHRAILNAVRNGDSAAAQAAMASHLSDVLAFWLSR
jgi:DNA-binding FadR family transcriptional regulator